MNGTKKMLAIMIAMTLLTAVFVWGCQPAKNEQPAEPAQASEETAKNPVAEEAPSEEADQPAEARGGADRTEHHTDAKGQGRRVRQDHLEEQQ